MFLGIGNHKPNPKIPKKAIFYRNHHFPTIVLGIHLSFQGCKTPKPPINHWQKDSPFQIVHHLPIFPFFLPPLPMQSGNQIGHSQLWTSGEDQTQTILHQLVNCYGLTNGRLKVENPKCPDKLECYFPKRNRLEIWKHDSNLMFFLSVHNYCFWTSGWVMIMIHQPPVSWNGPILGGDCY